MKPPALVALSKVARIMAVPLLLGSWPAPPISIYTEMWIALERAMIIHSSIVQDQLARADCGDASAQHAIANRYRVGLGVQQDLIRAYI